MSARGRRLAPRIAEPIQHRVVADVAGPRLVPRPDWKGSGRIPRSGPSTYFSRYSTFSNISTICSAIETCVVSAVAGLIFAQL
jgi:hypothetical protein